MAADAAEEEEGPPRDGEASGEMDGTVEDE